MTDAEFLSAFESATLPKTAWTHKAHVRVAWLYLKQHDANWKVVLPLMREGIQRLNQAHHVTTGYHETITVAFLRLIASRMQANAEHMWETFQVRHCDLLDYTQPIFLEYYHTETIFSDRARQQFVEPDRNPLPE